jgi:hypothetical protein
MCPQGFPQVWKSSTLASVSCTAGAGGEGPRAWCSPPRPGESAGPGCGGSRRRSRTVADDTPAPGSPQQMGRPGGPSTEGADPPNTCVGVPQVTRPKRVVGARVARLGRARASPPRARGGGGVAASRASDESQRSVAATATPGGSRCCPPGPRWGGRVPTGRLERRAGCRAHGCAGTLRPRRRTGVRSWCLTVFSISLRLTRAPAVPRAAIHPCE